MKKVFSLMTALALMLTLSACGEEKPCEPEVVEKEVIKEVEKIVEKEVIKEVPVEVEVPADVEMERQYQPGTYFKAAPADENGVVTFAVVVVDDYGRLIGVHVDNTSATNKYKYDEEEDKLYVYVKGVEDVIPNSYRYIDTKKSEWKIPTINDSILNEDLVEGYPWHDAKIAKLASVAANETKRIADNNSEEEKTWSSQMDLVEKEIIKDQTTYGINLYTSGDKKLTNTVSNVDIEIEKELELVQSILDNEAKLIEGTVLPTRDNAVKGLYEANKTKFVVGKPHVEKAGVVYNTALVITDDYGMISSVVLDETYSKNDTVTTKQLLGNDYGMKSSSPVGKEWFEQIDVLEDAVVATQSYAGIKFSSHDDAKKELELTDLSKLTEDKELKNPAEISNLAGVTIEVNEIIFPLVAALDSLQDITLEAGVYSAKLGDDLMTIVVDGGKIVAVNLDTLYKQDQAYIDVEGEEYPLYVYDKGSLDLSLEEIKTSTLIYKDGEVYKHATNEGVDHKKAYEAGDTVKFDYEGYDEEATIKPVVANSTKKSLNERYGMATEEGKLEWYEQAKLYEDYVVENGYNAFNIIGTKTDSVAGLTMNIDSYNALLQQLVVLADDKDNVDKAYTKAYTLADLGLDGNYKLAKGSYAFNSDIPTKDGGQYILNVIVVDDSHIYSSLDETIELDGKLTTKNSLGKEYRVELKNEELVKVDNEEEMTYAEFMKTKLEQAIDGDKINVLKALNKYDYELGSTIEYDKEEDKLIDDDLLDVYTRAFEKILIQSLQAKVTEVMDDVLESVKDQLDKQYIVAKDGNVASDKQLKVTINDSQLKLGEDANAKPISIEFDMESLTDDVEVDDVKGTSKVDYVLEAEADDITTSTKAKFLVTLEFEDYPVVTKEYEVPVLSNYDYKVKVLNETKEINEVETDINKNLGMTYENVLSGSKLFTLDLNSRATLDLDRLGDNNAVNKELLFKVNGLDNVKAYVTGNVSYKDITTTTASDVNAVLTFNAGKLTSNAALTNAHKYQFNVHGTSIEFTVTTADIAANTDLLVAANWTVKDVKIDNKAVATVEDGQKALANAFVVKTNDIYAADTVLAVIVDPESVEDNKGLAEGKFVVKGFFDKYDQNGKKEGEGIYQKGEASRDFAFNILSEKSALKVAKEQLGTEYARYGIQSEVTIPLLKSADLEIQGLSVDWFNNGEAIVDNKLVLTPETSTKQVLLQALIHTGSENDVSGDKTAIGSTNYNAANVKDYDISISAMSEYAVREAVEKQLDAIKFNRYEDIKALSNSGTQLSSKQVRQASLPEGVQLEYQWKDVNDKDIEGNGSASIYYVANKQVKDMNAGDVKKVVLTAEVTYDYKEKEFKLTKEYSFNVFANEDYTFVENAQIVIDKPQASVSALRLFVPTVSAAEESVAQQLKNAIDAGYKNIIINAPIKASEIKAAGIDLTSTNLETKGVKGLGLDEIVPDEKITIAPAAITVNKITKPAGTPSETVEVTFGNLNTELVINSGTITDQVVVGTPKAVANQVVVESKVGETAAIKVSVELAQKAANNEVKVEIVGIKTEEPVKITLPKDTTGLSSEDKTALEGKLDKVEVEVKVPEVEQPKEEVEEPTFTAVVATANEFNAALNDANVKEILLANDIDVEGEHFTYVNRDVKIDGQGNELRANIKVNSNKTLELINMTLIGKGNNSGENKSTNPDYTYKPGDCDSDVPTVLFLSEGSDLKATSVKFVLDSTEYKDIKGKNYIDYEPKSENISRKYVVIIGVDSSNGDYNLNIDNCSFGTTSPVTDFTEGVKGIKIINTLSFIDFSEACASGSNRVLKVTNSKFVGSTQRAIRYLVADNVVIEGNNFNIANGGQAVQYFAYPLNKFSIKNNSFTNANDWSLLLTLNGPKEGTNIGLQDQLNNIAGNTFNHTGMKLLVTRNGIKSSSSSDKSISVYNKIIIPQNNFVDPVTGKDVYVGGIINQQIEFTGYKTCTANANW